jgi:NADH-quinone oxidoreductase subunit A
MEDRMTTPTMIAGYLALFVAFGFAFLFVNLLVGKFLRPKAPNPEKLEVYECGEPTIGSSFVQFDIRFYVVALLFIIFDVEVAFFFPWATVFGKANQLRDPNMPVVTQAASSGGPENVLSPAAAGLYNELSVPAGARPATETDIRQSSQQLAWLGLIDIMVFFAVLLVGFAYVWRRGDLDWVRAVEHDRTGADRAPPTVAMEREPVLMG